MNRIPWDTFFMDLACIIAERSTCIRRHVGAVAVRDKRVVATGYNGAPPRVPHCTEKTCLRTVMNIPSGERSELCCLDEATSIHLLDGRTVTLGELYDTGEDSFWVYAYDASGTIVPALAHSLRYTGYRECVEVILDNQACLICTPDHLVLKRDGTYSRADELQYGTSLMAMYMNYSCNGGYESVALRARYEYPRPDDPVTMYSTPTHQLVAAYAGLEAPSGYAVHHLDHNYLNNVPSNLQVLSTSEHTKLHGVLANQTYEDHVRNGRKGIESQRRLGTWQDPIRRKKLREATLQQWQDPEYTSLILPILRDNCNRAREWTNHDPRCIRLRSIGKIYSGISNLRFLSEEPLTAENYERIRRECKHSAKLRMPGAIPPTEATILKYFDSLEEVLDDARSWNHKVVAVRRVGKRHVFDLTVPGPENVAITAGKNSSIFVHNCALHSEQNLLVQAAKFGFSLDGCTVYCTHMPCFTCAKLLYSVGIRQVFYIESYPDPISEKFLASVSMRVSRLHGYKRPIYTSQTPSLERL